MSTDTTPTPDTDVADLQYAPSTSLRAQFVPVGIGLAVALAATILWGIRAASSPVPTLATISVIAAVALAIARTKSARYSIATAALWAAMWSTWGASWFLTALGATLIGLCGIPWWQARYISNHGDTSEPDPEPEMPAELVSAAKVIDLWEAHVAAEGPLKGSCLALRETNGRVHKFLVRLLRGKQTYTQLLAQKEAIASAMNVPEANVIIERGPTAAAARLTVITDTRSGKPVMYTGPRFDPETGLVGIGRYEDDGSEAFLSVIAANGSFGATFCGDQGSGKSAAMEQMVLSLLASGYFVGVYIDPQDGYSSPALMQACKYKATSVEEAAKVIRQLPLLRRIRQIIFKEFGWNGYTLSKKHPVLLVVIDEFQEVANELSNEDQAILVKMAKTFRKIGAAFVIGTQTIGVQSFGGNSDLREQLMSRNVVYFYTSSKVQGRLSGNNEFDPSTLDSGTPGYGLLKEIKINGKLITRAAPFRAYHLGAKEDFGGRNPGVVWAQRLQVDYPFADMPPEEAGALAEAFAELDADHAFKALADRNLLEACRSVGLGELDPENLELYTAPLPKGPKPETQGIGLPSLRLGGPQPDETDPADEYPEKTQAVINALRAGAWRTAEIVPHAARAGHTVSGSLVETRLREFVAEGQAVRVETGHYHAVGYETNCGHPRCKG